MDIKLVVVKGGFDFLKDDIWKIVEEILKNYYFDNVVMEN